MIARSLLAAALVLPVARLYYAPPVLDPRAGQPLSLPSTRKQIPAMPLSLPSPRSLPALPISLVAPATRPGAPAPVPAALPKPYVLDRIYDGRDYKRPRRVTVPEDDLRRELGLRVY